MWPIVEWISTIARLSAVSTGMRHARSMPSFAIASAIERQDGFGGRGRAEIHAGRAGVEVTPTTRGGKADFQKDGWRRQANFIGQAPQEAKPESLRSPRVSPAVIPRASASLTPL